MNKIAPALFSTLLFFHFIVLFSFGCSTSRQLDPAGPYKGDQLLWTTDKLIVEIDETLDLVEALAAMAPRFTQRPDVAAALVFLRQQRDGVVDRNPDGTIAVHEVFAQLVAARDVYADTRAVQAEEDLLKKWELSQNLLRSIRQLIPNITPEQQPPNTP